MDRMTSVVVVVVGVAAVIGLGIAGGPLSPLALLAGGTVVLGLQRLRLRPVREVDWGGAALDGAVWAPLPVLVAGAGPAPRRLPSPPWRLSRALARVESAQLARSPWFAAGLGLCLVMLVLFGWMWAADANTPWELTLANLPVMAHPLTGMAVVAAHSAVTRARRDGTAELIESCPLSPATRTAGHLLTAWVPVVAVALFMGAFFTLLASRAPLAYGPIDGSTAGDAAAALALAAGGVALGVALGRWAPWRLVPVIAVAALVQPIAAVGNIGEPHWSNARQLSAWPQYPEHDLVFTIRPVWWHLLWLLALAAVVAGVALARGGWRRVAVPLAAAAAVAAVAGVAQTRPVSSGEAARLASLVAEPERHQVCRPAGPGQVCAYEGYERFASEMAAEVAPVMNALPPAGEPVVLRQVFDGKVRELGPEVARALAGRGSGGGPATLMQFQIDGESRMVARLTAALAAVSLPARAPADEVPALVAGQARGVLALWLAARGLPAAEAEKLATTSVPVDPGDPASLSMHSRQARGSVWPSTCSVGPPPVTWAPEDLAAARAVLALPDAQVAGVVRSRWAELTDPAATTDDLLVAVGLAPAGPPPTVVLGPVECEW